MTHPLNAGTGSGKPSHRVVVLDLLVEGGGFLGGQAVGFILALLKGQVDVLGHLALPGVHESGDDGNRHVELPLERLSHAVEIEVLSE